MASTSGVAEAATRSFPKSIRRSFIHCASRYVNAVARARRQAAASDRFSFHAVPFSRESGKPLPHLGRCRRSAHHLHRSGGMELDRAPELNMPITPPEYLRRPARHSSGLLERLATGATNWTGRNSAFACAMALVIGWLVSGPIFHYSDRWELFINTITSVVTFVMVFVIQQAQNKDTLALQ